MLGAPGPEVIKIHGGGDSRPQRSSSRPKVAMQGTYASTTECIRQNLTMKVGNPSARCFANAPWRAFTWTCALLQETNTQPWGNLQPAVQESLELAEAVDLFQLPGLHPLWKNTTSTFKVMQIILSRITSNSPSWLTSPTTGRKTPASRTCTMDGPIKG